jgi:hypothetical protein
MCQVGATGADGVVDSLVWRDCMETQHVHTREQARARVALDFAHRDYNGTEQAYGNSSVDETDRSCEEAVQTQSWQWMHALEPIKAYDRIWDVCMRRNGAFHQ